MAQHLVKVVMVIDADDEWSSDYAVLHMLQKRLRRREKDSQLIEWMYEMIDDRTASVRPLKPIRNVGAGDNSTVSRIVDEYDRAVAVKALEKNND